MPVAKAEGVQPIALEQLRLKSVLPNIEDQLKCKDSLNN